MSFNTVMGPADVRVTTHKKSVQAFFVLGATVVMTGLLAMVGFGVMSDAVAGKAPFFEAMPVAVGFGVAAVATAVFGKLLSSHIIKKAREKWAKEQSVHYGR